MDVDPEDEPPHYEQVLPSVPEAALVTPTPTTTTRLTTPKFGSGRRLTPFALLGIMTIGPGIAAFFAVRDSTTPSEAVASALTNSLKFKSAATATSIRIKEPGGAATITSEGVTNFDAGATTQVERVVAVTNRRRTHHQRRLEDPCPLRRWHHRQSRNWKIMGVATKWAVSGQQRDGRRWRG
jgi:hypothetical protein